MRLRLPRQKPRQGVVSSLPDREGGDLSVELKSVARIETAPADKLAFAPDGRTLAAVWPRGVAILHELEPVAELGTPGESLRSARFDRSGEELLAAPLALRVADRAWAPLPPLGPALESGLDADPRGGFSVETADWTPDGALLLVYAQWTPQRRIGAPGSYGGPTERLLLLKGRTRELVAVLAQGEGAESFAALAAGDERFAAAGRGVSVWDRAGERLVDLPAAPIVARVVRFSPDGSLLAVGRADGSAAVWTTDDWTQAAEWKAHEADVRSVAFHPAAPLVATGGSDDRVKLWTYEGEARGEADAGAPVQAVEFDPEGGRLAAAGEGTLHLYEVTEV